MLYEPELWDEIQKKFPSLKVGEKGFSETEGSLDEVHFSLHLATAETTRNFLVLTGISPSGRDLETLRKFVTAITEVFLPTMISRAYKQNRSIVVLWGILPAFLEKEFQDALDRNPDAQRIEL